MLQAYVPILVLTADLTPESRLRALSMGARDYLTKPFNETEVLLRIRNVLETRFLYLEAVERAEALEDMVRERTKDLADQLAQTQRVAEHRRSLLSRMARREAHPSRLGSASTEAQMPAGTPKDNEGPRQAIPNATTYPSYGYRQEMVEGHPPYLTYYYTSPPVTDEYSPAWRGYYRYAYPGDTSGRNANTSPRCEPLTGAAYVDCLHGAAPGGS